MEFLDEMSFSFGVVDLVRRMTLRIWGPHLVSQRPEQTAGLSEESLPLCHPAGRLCSPLRAQTRARPSGLWAYSLQTHAAALGLISLHGVWTNPYNMSLFCISAGPWLTATGPSVISGWALVLPACTPMWGALKIPVLGFQNQRLWFFLMINLLYLAVLSLLLCMLFSSCGEQGLLSSCSAQVLLLLSMGSRPRGLTVVALRLSCSASCRIFLDQGLNLCLLHWQILYHEANQGSPRDSDLISIFSKAPQVVLVEINWCKF